MDESTWDAVKRDLRGKSLSWWEQNKDSLIGLTRDEIYDMGVALRVGNTFDAKLAIARNFSREEWTAYRDGTTQKLAGIAERRYQLIQALGELGKRLSNVVIKAIGVAIVGVLAA